MRGRRFRCGAGLRFALPFALIVSALASCGRPAPTALPPEACKAMFAALQGRMATMSHPESGATTELTWSVGDGRLTEERSDGSASTFVCTPKGLALQSHTERGQAVSFEPPVLIAPRAAGYGEYEGDWRAGRLKMGRYRFAWDAADADRVGELPLKGSLWRSMRSALVLEQSDGETSYATDSVWSLSAEGWVCVRRMQVMDGDEHTVGVENLTAISPVKR
jgi:predicted small lipoprotein YifL